MNPASMLGFGWSAMSDAPLSIGEPPSLDDVMMLRAKSVLNPTVNKAINKLSGPSYAGLGIMEKTESLSNLIQFLREDDPNVPVSDLVERALNRGVKYTPDSTVGGVGEVHVPFKTEEGLVKPAIDLSGYRQALGSLNNLLVGRQLPKNLDAKKVSIRIVPTQAEFERQYRAISNTDRDLSGTQGVNFAIRPDGTEITRSVDIMGDMSNKTSVILINHELNQNTAAEFGGDNSIAETVLHEYAHSVHRSMGINWGDANAPTVNPKNAPYQTVRGQKVSEYGENNDQEHFAETFAKYLITGDASPEFKAFLADQVGLKELDLNAAFPEYLRGSNLRDQFLAKMRDADLGGFTINIDKFTNPYSQYTDNQLAAAAQDASSRGELPRGVILLSGTISDSRGRFAGTFSRTFKRQADGSLSVYHGYFKLEGSAQGGGFGNTFIQTSFDLYRSWGAESVGVSAALENGPYMWAIQGFDFDEESVRARRIANVKDYGEIFAEYNKDGAAYDNMSVNDAAAEISTKLADRGVSLSQNTLAGHPHFVGVGIAGLLAAARKNGWVIDNTFINELLDLAQNTGSRVTAKMIAELGRRNKRSLDKNSSSIGRYLMMRNNWSGTKKL